MSTTRTTVVSLVSSVRPFIRFPAPKSYCQEKIKKAVESKEEELWRVRKLLFDNEEHGHFIEKVQVAEQARSVAEGKLREKRAWIAANQHKIEEGGRAMDRLDLLEEELASKDDDFHHGHMAYMELSDENLRLHEAVAHMTARYDQLGATANELAEAQARLQGTCQRYKAVNTQLQKKLKIVRGAFRKMLVAAKRPGPGNPNPGPGRRMDKALRRRPSATRRRGGVAKKRS